MDYYCLCFYIDIVNLSYVSHHVDHSKILKGISLTQVIVYYVSSPYINPPFQRCCNGINGDYAGTNGGQHLTKYSTYCAMRTWNENKQRKVFNTSSLGGLTLIEVCVYLN
jgi:hypothetical protein